MQTGWKTMKGVIILGCWYTSFPNLKFNHIGTEDYETSGPEYSTEKLYSKDRAVLLLPQIGTFTNVCIAPL